MMLFLSFFMLENFIDWFTKGGFFLFLCIPIVCLMGYLLYQQGKNDGRRDK